MRPKRNHRPRWTTLTAIMLAAVGGLALEHGLHLTPTGHKLALLLVIAALYGWLGLWVKSNAAALDDLDAAEYRARYRDPALYGTPAFPTRTQFHFRETVSFYRREAPDRRGKS